MANNDNKHERKAFVAKKNESKVAKAQRTQKIIYGIFAGIIAVVLILVGVGIGSWYKNDYKPMKATVISVGDRDFNGNYYVDMLSLVSSGYPAAYASLFTNYASYYVEVCEIVYREAGKLGFTPDESTIASYISASGIGDSTAAYDYVRASYLQNQLITEYFTPKLAETGEYRDVYLIMCKDEVTAESAVNAIKGGISWETAFEDYSSSDSMLDTPAIGLVPKGLLDSKISATGVEEAVFAANVGEICTTKIGDDYWVYTATSSVEKAYTEDDKLSLANALCADWVDEVFDANKDIIVENLTEDFLKVACEKVAG